MARTNIKDSATSQFFICSATTPWLDGEYAAFGKTTDEKSNDIVVEISKRPKGMLSPAFQDFPYELIWIEEVLISDEKFID